MQAVNYQIILNVPEIDLKTGRTNSATKSREEATLKKVRSMDTQLGREMDYGHCGRERALVSEKGKRQTSIQGSSKGKGIPIAIDLESESFQISRVLAISGA